jgi:branched-chain amino acid transport system permease protein
LVVQQLVNGLGLGSVYALIALGLTLTYAVLRLLNLSHGAMIVVGGYVGFSLATITNNVIGSVVGGILCTALLGVILERFVFRPVRERPFHIAFIISIGVSIALEEMLRMFFYGGLPIGYPSKVQLTGTIQLGSLSISRGHLFVLGASILCMILLHRLLFRSSMGRGLRALAENRLVALILGVNQDRAASLTFALVGGLAGAAGVFFGLIYTGLNPYIGGLFVFKGFAIILFAGVGNIYGAIFSGLGLGIAEVLVMVFVGTAWRDFIAFTIIIAILILKPRGLFGSLYLE